MNIDVNSIKEFMLDNYKYFAYAVAFLILALIGKIIDSVRQKKLREKILSERASGRAGQIDTITPTETLENMSANASVQNIGKVGLASVSNKAQSNNVNTENGLNQGLETFNPGTNATTNTNANNVKQV